MKNKAILISVVTIAMHFVCSGQESLQQQFSDKPKPIWSSKLKVADLCVKASLVKLDTSKKERLLDNDGNVLVEYFPVDMNIDKILLISPRMAFDYRFTKESESTYKVEPQFVKELRIFLPKVVAGSVYAITDAQFIGANPQLPDTGIFMLEKSNHKKEGEFLISGYSPVESEEDYRKAISEEQKKHDAQQAGRDDGDKPPN